MQFSSFVDRRMNFDNNNLEALCEEFSWVIDAPLSLCKEWKEKTKNSSEESYQFLYIFSDEFPSKNKKRKKRKGKKMNNAEGISRWWLCHYTDSFDQLTVLVRQRFERFRNPRVIISSQHDRQTFSENIHLYVCKHEKWPPGSKQYHWIISNSLEEHEKVSMYCGLFVCSVCSFVFRLIEIVFRFRRNNGRIFVYRLNCRESYHLAKELWQSSICLNTYVERGVIF